MFASELSPTTRLPRVSLCSDLLAGNRATTLQQCGNGSLAVLAGRASSTAHAVDTSKVPHFGSMLAICRRGSLGSLNPTAGYSRVCCSTWTYSEPGNAILRAFGHLPCCMHVCIEPGQFRNSVGTCATRRIASNQHNVHAILAWGRLMLQTPDPGEVTARMLRDTHVCFSLMLIQSPTPMHALSRQPLAPTQTTRISHCRSTSRRDVQACICYSSCLISTAGGSAACATPGCASTANRQHAALGCRCQPGGAAATAAAGPAGSSSWGLVEVQRCSVWRQSAIGGASDARPACAQDEQCASYMLPWSGASCWASCLHQHIRANTAHSAF
jgi:hypothetical protein